MNVIQPLANLLRLASLVVLVTAIGCQPPEPTFVKLTGKVNFQGAGVKEGAISFENSQTGTGGSATIIMGEYSATIQPGNYQVSINPPTEEVSYENSPSDVVVKKVDDIPKKYWTPSSSGLTATVGSEPEQKVDFDLAN